MEDSLDKGYDYDLLFVDDGSKDNTIDHVQHLASLDQHVKYISFSRNFVKRISNDSWFFSIIIVKCDAVVMVDGDLQHPQFIHK